MSDERAPMTDVLAEQSVLGAAMLSERALAEIVMIISPADMYQPRHDVILSAIGRVHAKKEIVDVVSVTDELIRAKELHQAGGAEYLHTLTSIVPTAANAAYYASVVREYALARELHVIGQTLQGAGHDDVGEVLTGSINRLLQVRDREAGPNHQLRMLRDVLAVPANEDQYDWAVPGLLERRDRLMLTGSEGGGKSTLLRQIAVLSAAGLHPFKFIPIKPVRVLVVDVENSERQWRRAVRRIAEMAAARGSRDPQDSVALECLPRMDITKAAELGKVHRLIDKAKPDLLLIGPLYRLTKGSINSDDDAAPLLAALDSLRDRELAMLIEAHAGHTTSAAGERDLRPRGSSALLGWPEFGLGIRPSKKHGAFQVVRWRGDRDAREWPGLLMRAGNNPNAWPWEPTVALT